MSYGGAVTTQTVALAVAEPFGLKAALQSVRQSRATGQPKSVLGAWHMLPGANLARLAASQGWDFILIDTEHGNIDDAEMHSLVAAIGAISTCSPVVRIAGLEPWLIKRALDTGAHAIMCPMVSTVEEARLLASACRFPSRLENRQKGTQGIRGVGSPFSPALWNRNLQEYIDTANDNIIIIAQIENQEGLENCEAIAAVDGIDMLFVGPNDLASSLGYRAADHETNPVIQEAIERVQAAADKHGKYSGMFCTVPEQVNRRTAQGLDFLNCGTDVSALLTWNAEALNKMSESRRQI